MKNSQSANQQNKLSDNIDSADDQEKMKREITEINLPGVEDIPGQKNVKPQSPVRDSTASSSDEEGENVLNDESEDAIITNTNSNVTDDEKRDLKKAANEHIGDADKKISRASLDSTDEDGVPLNEGSFGNNISPSDLDVPGTHADDAAEDIGSEDEENNNYSLGGDDNETSPPTPRGDGA